MFLVFSSVLHLLPLSLQELVSHRHYLPAFAQSRPAIGSHARRSCAATFCALLLQACCRWARSAAEGSDGLVFV